MKANPIRQPAPSPKDFDFGEIRALAVTAHEMQRQQLAALTPIAQRLIHTGSHDANQIERALDRLLDCACIPEGLAIFKTLCRYYYAINPAATTSYVHAYRDMWDSEAESMKAES